MLKFLKSIFGSRNQRLLRQYGRLVTATNALDERMRSLPDEAFPGLTATFRDRLQKGETLDSLLPEALQPFARLAVARWECVILTCS